MSRSGRPARAGRPLQRSGWWGRSGCPGVGRRADREVQGGLKAHKKPKQTGSQVQYDTMPQYASVLELVKGASLAFKQGTHGVRCPEVNSSRHRTETLLL